jgi:hypothetical protein
MARTRSPQSREGRGVASEYNIRAELDQADLAALRKALKAAGREAGKALRRELREAGKIVQEEIRARTPVRSGRLRTGTKVRVFSSLSVRVYNSTKRISRKYPGGYRYGKRLEFDPQFGGRHAFFYPGYEAARDQAAEAFNRVLEDAYRAYVKGE